jgi:hypothetical protein
VRGHLLLDRAEALGEADKQLDDPIEVGIGGPFVDEFLSAART